MHQLNESGKLPPIDDDTINLISHNISVLGHTWAFRRWYYANNFTIEQYTQRQTDFIMRFLVEQSS